MAEEPISHDELIASDVLDPFKKSAKEALDLTNQLTVAFSQLAKASGKEIQGINFGSVEDVEKFNKEIKRTDDIEKAYNQTQKEAIALRKQLADRDDEVVKGKLRLQQANREQTATLKQLVILEKAEAGSLQQLKAKLSLVTAQINKMSAAERDGTVAGKELIAQQKSLSNQLSIVEQKGGNFHRQVGNYTVGLGKLGKGIKGTVSIIGELGSALGFNTEAIERFVHVGSAINKTLKDINNTKNLSKVVTQAETVATEVNTVATEANAVVKTESAIASEAVAVAEVEQTVATEATTVATEEMNAAMYANPLGLILLAVLALGAALYGLNAYMTSSSDETKRLTRENERLIKVQEKQKVITEARITILQSELEVLKAQGAPLEEIRAKQAEINQEKNAELLLNIEVIKSSIALNKQKIQDIAVNNSLYESILEGVEATQRFVGADKAADMTAAIIAQNKKERAEEFVTALEEQENALIQAEADYTAFQNSLLVQAAEYDKEDAELSKKATDRIKEHNAHRAKLYQEDRDAKIKAEEEKLNRLLELRARLEALEADVTVYTDKEAETKRYMAQLAELNDIAERARDEGRFDQERYDKDLQLIETKHYEEMEKILDANTEKEIEEEKKKQDEITRINKEAEDARREALKESINEQIAMERILIDSYKDALGERRQDEDMYMRFRENQINSDLQTQQNLFNQGLDNTLGYEKKKKDEFYREQRALAKQRHDQEMALELAELFIELQKTYADEGLTGAAKAFSQTMAAKGLAQAIAGSYEKGTEDTGRASGRGLDGKGGRLFLLHDNERVLPKGLNSQLNGMSNDELVDNALAYEMYKQQLAGSLLPESIEESYADRTMEMLLLNGFMSLEKTVKNKREYYIGRHALKGMYEDIIEDGERRRTYFSRPRA